MKGMHEKIAQLDAQEAKGLLHACFMNMQRLAEGKLAPEYCAADLSERLERLSEARKQDYYTRMFPPGPLTRLHIIFGDSAGGSLKMALRQLELSPSHQVVVLRERYELGPLADWDHPQGRTLRWEWLQERLNVHDSDNGAELEEEYWLKQSEYLASLPSGVPITIWSGFNGCEQTGLRHAAYLLRNHRNAIYVIAPDQDSHLLFDTAEVVQDYRHSGEIIPEKLAAIFKHNEAASPLSSGERRSLEQEWNNLTSAGEELHYRIWEAGQLRAVGIDYFDEYLLGKARELQSTRKEGEFMKAARVIGEALGYSEQYVGDEFLEYRLRELVAGSEPCRKRG
ncbi:DUF1835 domain-containing protein [Paenibacillus tengchongensis]|uniref:DUF1835 domain-containing protein n=1 Tax=Paenibacillus tengchongensis TaxID=2608684 RepID=UPI00124E7D39|nr:DUF1835 domain-containing protein [Paenibacillus tengchongensis]